MKIRLCSRLHFDTKFEKPKIANAEWMAKNGQVPVLIGNKTSKNVYSGWRKITEMLEANNIMLCPGEGSISCIFVRV